MSDGIVAAPPIGLRPRYVAESERIEEIKAAMARYMREPKAIPIAWLEEYNELCTRLHTYLTGE